MPFPGESSLEYWSHVGRHVTRRGRALMFGSMFACVASWVVFSSVMGTTGSNISATDQLINFAFFGVSSLVWMVLVRRWVFLPAIRSLEEERRGLDSRATRPEDEAQR